MQNFISPQISVIIPAYNRAGTIRYCLDSVLAQTFSPIEAIVVDDCSGDETVDIVKNYDDPRVRCIVLDKNSGAQAARNRGIKEARGNWIAFQDSDDEWLPEKLEKQVQALTEVGFDPWTVVHANGIWLDTNKGCQLPPVVLPIVEGDNVYPLLLSQPGPMFQAMLVSKKALEKIDFLDENVPSYQEWDTAIRLSKYCRFIHIKEPLFIYHLHKGEMISKNYKRDIIGYQYVIDKFENEIKDVCGEKIWERYLFNQLERCLNFKLWKESDKYFHLVPSRDLRFRMFQICRRLYLTPKNLLRLKDVVFGKQTVKG